MVAGTGRCEIGVVALNRFTYDALSGVGGADFGEGLGEYA